MKWGIGLVVLCIFTFFLISMPAAAAFEAPEGAITFDSLGLSETYYGDTVIYQTKEVTLQFANPNEINIVIYTFRNDYFDARIYVNELIATENEIYSGNREATLTIPGAFIKTGENTIYLEFIDGNRNDKFSKYPLTIAPKSYILSTNGPIPTPTSTPTSLPTPTPIPTLTAAPTSTSTPASTQTENPGFTIIDIQKSSETSPEINIEPIDKQKLSDATVNLRGTASSDSGIESVTVNGQYAGTEHWELPVDLSLGDGNIVIIATGNDGNTTIQNIGSKSPSSESESKSDPNIGVIIAAIIGLIGTIITVYFLYKKEKEKTKK